MKAMPGAILLSGVLLLGPAVMAAPGAHAQEAMDGDPQMTFFVTSHGPGDGGNLGGLAGADAHCQALADAAGSQGFTWRAYLSAAGTDARTRIGEGPWYNAKGVLIARDVEGLHSPENQIGAETTLDESGEPVAAHEILTGSSEQGTALAGAERTCAGWTSADPDGSAMVGLHDRAAHGEAGNEAAPGDATGGEAAGGEAAGDAPSGAWNASHATHGCSQENLRATGGEGLFYCFALSR